MKQKINLILIAMFALIISACTKNNTLNLNNIDEHQWKLLSIATASGFSSPVPDIQHGNQNDRYLLTFNKENHTVRMFLVANWWDAQYSFLDQDSICLCGSTTTEVGYAGNEIWVEDTLNAYG